MKISQEQRRAARVAREIAKTKKGITLVYIGYKSRAGERTDEVGIVFGVEKKKPLVELGQAEILPASIAGIVTDVIETGIIRARAFIQKRRPCPPGFSIGHVSITAGTLGSWVKRAGNEDWIALSNNHVFANSNSAILGDTIIQPGKADGGFSGTDSFARLAEFAVINFDDAGGGKDKDGKKNSSLVRLWWSAWQAIPNAIANLVGCPRRLRVLDMRRHPQMVGSRAVGQPSPNLIDAAIATPLNQGYVRLDIPQIGEPLGIRDLELGDAVQKSGRTTEYTTGIVEGVDVQSTVSYGGPIAQFDDQILIVGNGTEFSAPGDSGSGIFDMSGYLGALLFAGGSEGGRDITIANRISNVVAILGVRL